MILSYLILIIVISFFEAKVLYKKGETKDMFVYLGCMVFVAAFGVAYFLADIRFSLIEYLLNFIHMEG